jgi:hypothetical protein
VPWPAEERRDVEILRVVLAFDMLSRLRARNEAGILLFKRLLKIDVGHRCFHLRSRRSTRGPRRLG